MLPHSRSALSTPASQGGLSALFRPNSIAVIGASPTSDVRRQSLELYKQIGYSGKVAAVNPKYEEIAGYPCYPSLKSMPFVPDAVLILRNREATLAALEEAADVGVRAAVVPEIGFAEAGAEGTAAQARLVDIARTSGMAVLGPNSGGVINWLDRVHLNMSSFEVRRPGQVAFFSQGGGTRAALIASRRGVRWSHAITCGNEAVTGSADFLRYFVDDPRVRVICGFVEAVRDPDRFFFECDRARAAGKPVILLKPGRTEASREMAAAHTGALTSPYQFYRELFKRHGVVQVDSFEELLASALIAQAGRSPGEGRLGVACPSGGLVQMYLDESAKCPALSYAEFEPRTVNALRSLLPDSVPCRNLLDFWGIEDLEEGSRKIFQTIASDPNVDIFAAPYDPNHPGASGAAYKLWADCAVAAAAATNKLVTLITPVDGSIPPEKVEEFLDKNVLVLGQRDVFRALDRAVAWARPTPPIADEQPIDISSMATRLHEFGGKPFAGKPALDFLAAAGIQVIESRFVTSAGAAISAADELGYPVVAKIGDTGVLHRTELSGVITNLRNAEELSAAATKLFAAGSQFLMIQPYVRDGIEMILGLQTDDVLGSFVLVGQGGIWTEIMEDVALRPAGLRVDEPEHMLAELRVEKLLRGVRGASALDTKALVGAVRRLDAVARGLGDQIRSIDINPLFVRERGVVAVDALIVPSSNGRSQDTNDS
ncbi:acetate--CoA ligase family protein [Bradyrhizobium huanghuaihaiense]|uniref:acetate--CoA ligase family protein n=1 Tax=Bradyrhizobium huanghuaihaiense TaxID=990078 RepID=UPI0021AAACA4|nr:acetate--CoA ligase family protein [Bradyrhizobium sp. CB3035]UWU75846.1 acetate--CoA ligase family protein [Bradyrhizobium sp. CB3035]